MAADPHTYVLGALVDSWTDPDQASGGRPRKHPTWALVLFQQCISIFGSAVATQNALADRILWSVVVAEAGQHMPMDQMPSTGPNRDQYYYFTRRLEPHLATYLLAQTKLGAIRATEVGLADPTTASVTKLGRMHTMSGDGKVFNSPQRTPKNRLDRTTAELRSGRIDSARGQYREGGSSEPVEGTKFAIVAIRSPMAGHRVITGLRHVPPGDGRGEAGALIDLVIHSADRLPGLRALVTDGVLRGKHINEIQTRTGVQVLSPPTPRAVERGGSNVGGKGHQNRPLPFTGAQRKAFGKCRHELFAVAGGVHERVITGDGSPDWLAVERGQTKRQQRSDGTWDVFVHHRLHCAGTGQIHSWWEPFTPTRSDRDSKFNRGEYLRLRARTDPDYARMYGMRQDAESLNAQLEHKFHRNRLPAWGLHRQTLVVLGVVLAQNVWALHVWLMEAIRQANAPPAA